MAKTNWYGDAQKLLNAWDAASSVDEVCALYGLPTGERFFRQKVTKTVHALRKAQGGTVKRFAGTGKSYNRKVEPQVDEQPGLPFSPEELPVPIDAEASAPDSPAPTCESTPEEEPQPEPLCDDGDDGDDAVKLTDEEVVALDPSTLDEDMKWQRKLAMDRLRRKAKKAGK